MSVKNKILVVSPHMDDETLGVGGAICKHITEGDEVSVIVVANRAYNHFYDQKKIKNEESCCKQALKVLCVSKINFLRLKDEQLDEKLINIIKPLERVVDKIKPDIVYIPFAGDINQDHRATYQACMVVFRVINNFSPKKILCYEVPSSTDANQVQNFEKFNPNYFVDINKYINKKVKALKFYKNELKEFPHPRSVEGIEVYAKKRGMEAGCKYAEAFLLIRYIKK
ncbi:PIG-L deacetylase family protein [Patescibacteria group bacterium]